VASSVGPFRPFRLGQVGTFSPSFSCRLVYGMCVLVEEKAKTQNNTPPISQSFVKAHSNSLHHQAPGSLQKQNTTVHLLNHGYNEPGKETESPQR
jgi:hypothetical protein